MIETCFGVIRSKLRRMRRHNGLQDKREGERKVVTTAAIKREDSVESGARQSEDVERIQLI
jgi:hypothetical protein